jgi:hypothetical protein
VASLCLRGLLPHVRVGGQRRVRRCDVEALIEPSLSRQQLETLWLHRAVAGKTVLDVLTSSAEYAVELRATSPFAGILSEAERRTVLAAFAESRREHARPMPPDKLERVLRAV